MADPPCEPDPLSEPLSSDELLFPEAESSSEEDACIGAGALYTPCSPDSCDADPSLLLLDGLSSSSSSDVLEVGSALLLGA
mmetsp:Transcript_9460/g.23987  ORF Transcript_9460/g.23987 Transcript_9460/m.23987 type:complete len:81 (-) Transcript_9460:468-710(-)